MILNLHGLNGSCRNANYGQLLRLVGEDEIYSPQIDYVSVAPKDLLDDLAAAGPYSLVVGNSLGGFFAYAFGAAKGLPTVLTNPCVPPHDYLPGLADGYRYLGEVEGIWRNTYPSKSECTVILGTRDEVIDHERSAKLMEPYHRVFLVDSEHSMSGEGHERRFREACLAVL